MSGRVGTGDLSPGLSAPSGCYFGAVGAVVVPAGFVAGDGGGVGVFRVVVLGAGGAAVGDVGGSVVAGPFLEVVDVEADGAVAAGVGAVGAHEEDGFAGGAGEESLAASEVGDASGGVDGDAADVAGECGDGEVAWVDG